MSEIPERYKGIKIGDKVTVSGESVPPGYEKLIGVIQGISEEGLTVSYDLRQIEKPASDSPWRKGSAETDRLMGR